MMQPLSSQLHSKSRGLQYQVIEIKTVSFTPKNVLNSGIRHLSLNMIAFAHLLRTPFSLECDWLKWIRFRQDIGGKIRLDRNQIVLGETDIYLGICCRNINVDYVIRVGEERGVVLESREE